MHFARHLLDGALPNGFTRSLASNLVLPHGSTFAKGVLEGLALRRPLLETPANDLSAQRFRRLSCHNTLLIDRDSILPFLRGRRRVVLWPDLPFELQAPADRPFEGFAVPHAEIGC